MADIDIFLKNDVPELSLNDSDVFLDGAPLLVFNYSGLRVTLTKTAFLHLKDAIKQGDGMFENYRLFMESENNLKLPF